MAQQYPKAKYHATNPPALVENEKEEAALGEGWFDHPSLKNKPVFLASGEVVEAPAPKVQPKAEAPKVEVKPTKEAKEDK